MENSKATRHNGNDIFITNQHGYFFRIITPIDTAKLENCDLHETESSFWEAVAEATGVSPDVVNDAICCIMYDNERWIESDCRGVWSVCDLGNGESIERYLSEYII